MAHRINVLMLVTMMNCYVFSRCVSLAKVDTFCGYICMFCLFVWGEFFLPILLSQNRAGDFDACFCPSQTQCTATAPAVHCNRPRSALQPPLQCTASARTYLVYFKRKYMRPPRITFATADANVINRGCKRYKPLPQTFAGKGAHLGIPSPMVFQMSLEQVIDSH